MDASTARQMWLIGEPLHAVTYFAPESFAAWEEAGLRGFWRGYFATRAAPFGAVGPEVVTATFYNFAPEMVARALPSVWSLASPADALAARARGATDALRTILGPAADAPAVAPAAATLRAAADGCDLPGRALFAANAALAWPDEPLTALWHGLTLLREHRGDGHNAVLTAHGIDGCAAHILAGAAGGADRTVTQPARGWTDEAWASRVDALIGRGLLDDGAAITPAGAALHAAIEARTDELTLGPWAHVGATATAEVAAAVRPLAEAVVESGVIRFPNPMNLPAGPTS
jgi:hypothetical protein